MAIISKAGLSLMVCALANLTAGSQITNHNSRAVSLQECMELALAHNLNIQISRYPPQIVGYYLGASYGVFDPILTLDGIDNFTKQPGLYDPRKLVQTKVTRAMPFTTNAVGQEWPNETTIASAGPSVQGLLPFGLSYNIFARSTYYEATTFVITNLLLPQSGFPPAFNNPSSNNYFAAAGVTLSQPLLRNSWIDFYRRNIQLNRKNLQISELGLRGELMTNVTSVATAYYRLIFDREQIKVQASALEAAKQLLQNTRRAVQGGTLLPLDQQRAESSVETIQTFVFAAEQDYIQQQNALRNLITDDYQSWMGVNIVPSEDLEAGVELPANRTVSWANALLRRPDILQLRLELEKQDIILVFTHNQLFPTLNLIGSYGWAATEHTFSESLNVLRNGTFPNYSVGGVFAIPVANVTASSEYKASGLAKKQALLRFKRLQQSVITEVDTAVKLTETTFKQIASTRKSREFAQAALDSIQKQYEGGVTNSYFVVEYQYLRNSARFAEIRALADFHIAQARLALSEGTALERYHINLKLK